MTEPLSSDDGSSSDDSDDSSSPSPKRARNDSTTEELDEHFSNDDVWPVVDCKSEAQPAMESDVLEEVNVESNQVLNTAANEPIPAASVDGASQPPVKRKRGRPRKVRNETEAVPVRNETKAVPESGNSTNISESVVASVCDSTVAQDGGLVMTSDVCGEVGTVSTLQPMTLSLSPPPMPSGKVPQPAGVLLLPLYSSTPTEPGEQSSLMVVQPHQLANFPFAVGGHMAASGEASAVMPPVLTPAQPIVGPLVPHAVSQPAVYTLPSLNCSHTEPT